MKLLQKMIDRRRVNKVWATKFFGLWISKARFSRFVNLYVRLGRRERWAELRIY
jgi:hypothetical protein